jgi:hypothetical protein
MSEAQTALSEDSNVGFEICILEGNIPQSCS